MDASSAFTINIPFQANAATPAWLGHPVSPPTAFATLDLPIIPPDANASLLVTVYFQEKDGGFLRLTWNGSSGAQILSDNFYEGIGMANQRSLLITAQTLQGQGTLNFQCGDTSLGIQRIKLEWLENKTALVSPQVQDVMVTPATGLTQPAQDLSGQLAQANEAAWLDQYVNVPIADHPQRIEQGVEFSVQLDGVPVSGRLALKEAGLPLGNHLVVWINQQRSGSITPAVPDLTDDGFIRGANAPVAYVGWRDGSFYVPAATLKAGVNTIQFSVEDDTLAKDGTAADSSVAPTLPLAIKGAVLQLDYSPVQDAKPTSQPSAGTAPSDTPAASDASNSSTSSSTPTGPISP